MKNATVLKKFLKLQKMKKKSAPRKFLGCGISKNHEKHKKHEKT